jgi:small subunit ribosomal protein S2
MLIKQEKYLETGIHIGTKLRTIDMAKFIYRTRNDGLYVLDLRQIDERIRLAGKVLAKYEPEDIVIIASRTYSSIAARVFSKITGMRIVPGRFVPGVFTNIARSDFMEPKLVIICDPKGERQAVVECGKMGIPTVGFCDTDNFTMFIDWAIPCNNKGRRALALIFWLLAREMAMGKGKISTYEEFTPDFEAFEALSNEIADAESTRKKGKVEVPAQAEGAGEEAPAAEGEEPEAEKGDEGPKEEGEGASKKKAAKKKKAPKKAAPDAAEGNAPEGEPEADASPAQTEAPDEPEAKTD